MTHNNVFLAETIRTDPRFETEPVALFDALVERCGHERASEVWLLACRLYDEEQDDGA